MQMTITTPGGRRVLAPPGMSGLGIWSTLAKTGSSLLNTGATLYQTQQTTSAAKSASKAEIEKAKAQLALAQTEVEQRRIEAEIAAMEAENRRQFIKDMLPVGGVALAGVGVLVYLSRKRKRR